MAQNSVQSCPACKGEWISVELLEEGEGATCYFCGDSSLLKNDGNVDDITIFQRKVDTIETSLESENIDGFNIKRKQYFEHLGEVREFSIKYNLLVERLLRKKRVMKEIDGKSFMGGSLSMRVTLFGFSGLIIILSKNFSGTTTMWLTGISMLLFGIPYVLFLKKTKRVLQNLSIKKMEMEKKRALLMEVSVKNREEILLYFQTSG